MKRIYVYQRRMYDLMCKTTCDSMVGFVSSLGGNFKGFANTYLTPYNDEIGYIFWIGFENEEDLINFIIEYSEVIYKIEE